MQHDPAVSTAVNAARADNAIPVRFRPASGKLLAGVLLVMSALGGWLGWEKLHAYKPYAQEVFANPQLAYDFHLTDQNDRFAEPGQISWKKWCCWRSGLRTVQTFAP